MWRWLFVGKRKGEPPLDWWTIPHVLAGCVLATTGMSWLLGLGLLVGYEVLEAGLRRVPTKSGKGVFEYESWINIIADIIVGMVGFALVRLLMPGLRLLF